ncbi:hypothetical protein RUND412_004678 [Rhizina undulata]
MATRKRKRAEKTEHGGGHKEMDGPAEEEREAATTQSQKMQMIQFEKKCALPPWANYLREVKKQKTSAIHSTTVKFSQMVKAQEEKLITSLKERKAAIKSDSDEFSQALSAMFQKAFGPKFGGQGPTSTFGRSELIKNNPLRSHQLSLAEDSNSLVASFRYVHSTLTSLISNDLALGGGWEEEADETIRTIRQLQEEALLKVHRFLEDEEENDADNEDAREGWIQTVKKSEKHVRKFLKHLPLPISEDSD